MKRTLGISALLALAAFSVGIYYSGGGHGWGTRLLWITFPPVMWAAGQVYEHDLEIRCAETLNCPPTMGYEYSTVAIAAVGAIAEFVLIGLLIRKSYYGLVSFMTWVRQMHGP